MQNLMNMHQLSDFINFDETTIYANYIEWKMPYIKIGRNVRFDREDVRQWLASNKNKFCEEIKKGKTCRYIDTRASGTLTSRSGSKDIEGQLEQAINKKLRSLKQS